MTHNFSSRYSVIKSVLVDIPYSTCYLTLLYNILLQITVTLSPLTDGLYIPFTQTRKRSSPAISGWQAVIKCLDNSFYLWQELYGNVKNRNLNKCMTNTFLSDVDREPTRPEFICVKELCPGVPPQIGK